MPRRVIGTGIKGRRSSSSLSRISKYQSTKYFNKPGLVKVDIKLFGVNKLDQIIKKMIKDVESSTYIAIKQCSKLLVHEVQKVLSSGDYKAYKTGTLHDSITYVIEEYTKSIIYSVIGVLNTSIHYAIYVHEGTKWMKERPFLRIALRRKKKLIIMLLINAIRKDYIKGI